MTHAHDTPSSMTLDIVSAEGAIWSGRARMVSLRAIGGELGILPRHAALVTLLQPGTVRITTLDNDEECIYVSGGMLEVQPHVVTVLADTALRSTQIDEQAALAAKRHAEEMMRDSVLFIDRDAAHIELMQAMAQLAVLEHARRRRKPSGR
ncbi:MAG: F0F1 ATP synthase subunit epsilon [Ectothiorhodospiraceae bacterium]|jgi:F-type H+-transporting ATPase subunit epsilon|nr:F0F1 ATP synthase subunit epsilon [Ectothiorhodospiraceae bacterium]